MEQQLEQRVLKIVPEIPTGEVIHYIPHQPVIRDQAESTKNKDSVGLLGKGKFPRTIAKRLFGSGTPSTAYDL